MNFSKKTMVITIIQILLTALSPSVFAQKAYSDTGIRNNNGFDIVATNPYVYPISVKYNFKLTNLRSSLKNGQIVVVPPNVKNHKVCTLTIIKKNKRFGFSYENKFNVGDFYLNTASLNLQYDLPFEKGLSFKIDQGNNGNFSHKNINAIDFNMPVGTNVLAAREGIVVGVVDSNNKSCTRKECIRYNNYIRVFHPDGTFGVYVHIQHQGALVKEGDIITKGQSIAYSGNVGYSSGPHLHFEVYASRLDDKESLLIKFLINNGKKATTLTEKQTYKRNY